MNTEPLRKLTTDGGPFAAVYLDFSHDTEDAAGQLELRRREIRASLTEQGADDDAVARVDRAVAEHEPPAARAGLAVITGRNATVVQLMRRPLPQPVVRYSELPYLLPLAEWAQQTRPHVVVVVDRVGADFRVVDGNGRVRTEEQLTGREHPVHKVRGGGWSHRSMQSHVQETVKHNVQQVADETARLARLVNARAVIVAGEVQARSALLAALPESAGQVAVELGAGSRAPGGDEQALIEEIDAVLDRLAEGDQRDLLDRYRAESGRQNGRGVHGLAATTAALREGNAEVLLADPAPLQPLSVWSASNDHTVLGVSRGELRSLGFAEVVERRADEAIPFAALALDAQLFVSDDLELADGVGLLLRYR